MKEKQLAEAIKKEKLQKQSLALYQKEKKSREESGDTQQPALGGVNEFMENYIKKYSDTNGENEVDDLMKSTFFGHDQIDQETGELNEEGKFWLSGLAGKSAMNGGAQDDSTDQVQQFMDENSEF